MGTRLKSPPTTAIRYRAEIIIDILSAEDLRDIYDAVVLGGGPAGATAAAVLSRASLSVLLAEEKDDNNAFKVGETLPGIASRVMTQAGFCGVLRNVAKLNCSGNRSSWGSSSIEIRPGLLNPYGGGSHLDRAQFDRELLCNAVTAGVEVLPGARFAQCERSHTGWMLLLNRGRNMHRVRCNSVIDCTGRKACFARAQGVQRVAVDKQVAVAAVLSGDAVADDDLTTTIEASRDRWWYSARIPLGKRVVVYFSDGDLLRIQAARSSAGFLRLMEQGAQMREFLMAGYTVAQAPLTVLADTSYLNKAAGDGWCAAGDAAAALDPLASAGIIDAIQGGSAAATVVLSGFKNAEKHSADVIERARANIETRRAYYAIETRWADAPFWARRHAR
jgi:flavin-dependent dehydrogenase